MKEEILLYEVDEAWTPQYPVILEISASEVETRIGGIRGRVAKAKILIKVRERVLHMLALTQEEISRLISVLRSAQLRMELVSTRLPLEIKGKFVAKAEELGRSPSEYLRVNRAGGDRMKEVLRQITLQAIEDLGDHVLGCVIIGGFARERQGDIDVVIVVDTEETNKKSRNYKKR